MTGWSTVALGEVAVFDRDIIDASSIDEGALYVGLENIESGGRLVGVRKVDPGELSSSKFRFSPRHLLYGKLRPYLAKIARPQFTGICSTDIVPVLPGPNLDRDYLAHFLLRPDTVALANARSTGANLPRLSPQVLAEFSIPVPPLVEQRRIAEVLDRAEALRARRHATLTLLDTLAQTIFLDIFGDTAANPKRWPGGKLLGEVADIASGVTIGRNLEGKETREVPYLAVSNVHDLALDLTIVKITNATLEEVQRYRLIADDLVLTEGGDPDKLGRGTLWSNELPECIHQNHIFRVRLTSDQLTPLFLNWLVGSPRGKQYFLRSAKQTTGIASINMTQLRRFPLLLPPLSLQREFAVRVAAVETLKSVHRASLAQLDALFASLQHSAFRGEV